MNKGVKIAWVVVVVLVVTTAVVAQQSKRTATAEFGGELFSWALDTNVFELGGGAWLNVNAGHLAKMTATAMTVKTDDELREVQMLTASGPVKIEVLTAKSQSGLQRKMIASCSQKATYEEAKQLIQMVGDVKADVTTLPEGNVQAAHLTGETINIDLKTNTVSVIKAKMTVTTEIDTEKGEQ